MMHTYIYTYIPRGHTCGAGLCLLSAEAHTEMVRDEHTQNKRAYRAHTHTHTHTHTMHTCIKHLVCLLKRVETAGSTSGNGMVQEGTQNSRGTAGRNAPTHTTSSEDVYVVA